MKEENENLKNFAEEMKGKIATLAQNDRVKETKIEELLSLKNTLERSADGNKMEVVQKEEKFRSKFEEKEKQLVQKYKEREESMRTEYVKEVSQINSSVETYRLENEKLKIQVKNMQKLIDESENTLHEKEIEFKHSLDSKDKEYEKLQRALKDVQRSVHELESKYNEKQADYVSKCKNFEELEQKLFSKASNKDKKLKDSEDEVSACKNFILDLQANIKEYEIRSDNKDKMIEQLKNQNSEILREFNRKEFEYSSTDDNRNKDIQELLLKLNELNHEKNEVLQENEELRINLVHASDKLREMNDMIEDKYRGLEMNFMKEKNTRENSERKYKDALKRSRDKETNLFNENNTLKQVLAEREEEMNTMRLRYENKLQTVKFET